MDSVAFAFCDAVASILPDIPRDDANSSAQSPWKSAFGDHYANRMNLRLWVCFANGMWFYTLKKGSPRKVRYNYVGLEEIQKTRRKYVHLENLMFSNGVSHSASSLDEMRSVLKFLRPYVGPSAWLCLNLNEAPKEALADLLSPFSSAPFLEMTLFHYEEAFEDFLKKQIALDTLKAFRVYDNCPPAVELKTEYKRIQSERCG